MSIYFAILMAAISSITVSVGTALQKSAADRLAKLTFPPKLETIKAFLTSWRWMVAFGISFASWVFYLAAVRYAPISIVQPIMGLGLCVMALFSVFYLKEKLSTGEWTGVAAMIVGIIILGISSDVSEIRGLEHVSYTGVILFCLGCIAAIIVGGLIERKRPDSINVELALGAAGGIMFGLGAVLTRTMMLEFGAGNLPLVSLLFGCSCLANMIGVFLMQSGFQRGRGMTVVAVLAVVNKVVAVAGGFITLGEGLPDNTVKVFLRITAFAALLGSTVLLSRFGASKAAEPTDI
ncbi:MAG: EamA family transporter [Proteobacteria bacterium]|nr:EamA family transporter [Pseudomonadota bacterium]